MAHLHDGTWEVPFVVPVGIHELHVKNLRHHGSHDFQDAFSECLAEADALASAKGQVRKGTSFLPRGRF